MTNSRDDYRQIQAYAEEIAKKCVRLLRMYQNKFTVVTQKDAVDIATTADIASEKLAIALIHKKYPNHAIYSEEVGHVGAKSDFLWSIDPLDGTKEYVRGLSEYNCLISVEHKGRLVVGVIYHNGTDELYSCSLGQGALLNNRKVHVSATDELSKAFVGFHMPILTSGKEHIESQLQVVRRLVYNSYRLRPGWDDAKQFGWVARGVLDAHLVPAGLKNEWHDLASGILFVAEAGGTVTDWEGRAIVNHDISHGVLASNGKIHKQLLHYTRGLV